jgi:hypothetical protein
MYNIEIENLLGGSLNAMFNQFIKLTSLMAEVYGIGAIQDTTNVHGITEDIFPIFVIDSDGRSGKILPEMIKGFMFFIIHGKNTVGEVLFSPIMEFPRFRGRQDFA